VAIHLHVAPGVEIKHGGGARWLLYKDGTLVARIRCPEGTQSEVVGTEYYPEFGLALSNQTLIARWSGALPFCGETVISWGEPS
jgi:hypothetical protein